jgi:hypothetical protein
MGTLKSGDKVRALVDFGDITVGKVYEVSVDCYDDAATIEDDAGDQREIESRLDDGEMELVEDEQPAEPREFQVGDRVRLLDTSGVEDAFKGTGCFAGLEVGGVYEVKSIQDASHGGEAFLRVDNCVTGIYARRFELVEDEPEVLIEDRAEISALADAIAAHAEALVAFERAQDALEEATQKVEDALNAATDNAVTQYRDRA